MTAVPAFDTLTAIVTVLPQRRALDVLIVDDHGSARRGLAALLSLQPNINVVGQAVDGMEAIELAWRYIPHVVLMDLEMPLMDGIEATRRLKQLWPQMHVVILSNHDEWRDRALREGADAFLVKCGPPERLLTLLDQLYEHMGHTSGDA